MQLKSINQLTKGTFLLFLCIFFLTSLSAQENIAEADQAINDLITRTNMALGLDDELVNGEIYYQKNLSANGHPFYLYDDWSEGTVVVNGKVHQNLQLKYNIESNELILRITQKNGSSTSIVLNNSFIDSFYLDEHSFIHARHLNRDELKADFYEEIYNGSFSFYANYRKTFVSEYNSKNPYGRYSKIYVSYFLVDSKGLTKIVSKGGLLSYFESDKKEIKKFMKKNRINFKKANRAQLNYLLHYCDELSNSK